MNHTQAANGSYDYTKVPREELPIEHHGSSTEEQDAAMAEKAARPEGSNKMSTEVFLAVLALSATYVGSNISGYFIGVAFIYLVPDLGIGNEKSWLLIVNNLAFACIAPCAGYLQDIFGRRNALIIGSVGNILGSVLTGAANGFALAIVGLTVSGVGGAIGELTATAAIAELVPVRRRGIFLALNTAMNIPFIPVVLYGELLCTRQSWRWCFWIPVIWNVITFVSLLASYFRLDIQHIAREKRIAALKGIDYIGMLLLIAGCALFLIGLQAGGSTHPWVSAFVLCQIIIGLLTLVVFVLWEWKGASSPVVPFRLFQGQRVVGFVFIIAFVAGINYTFAQSLGTTLLTEVFRASPIRIGVYAVGPTAGLIVGATLSNVLFAYSNGRARELLFVFAAIMTAFLGASASLSPLHPVTYIVLSSFASFGIGGILIPVSTIATIACPEDLIGTAVALTAAVRTIGGAVGLAFLESIALSAGKKKVPKAIGAYAVKAGLPVAHVKEFVGAFYTNSPLVAKIPGVNKTILAAAKLGLQVGYAESFRLVFYTLIPFGVLAAALCLGLPNIAKLMTNKVVAPARGASMRNTFTRHGSTRK